MRRYFKLFDSENKIDNNIYDEMYSILHDNYLNREIQQNYDSEETPYDVWYDTITNTKNYYELLYYIDNKLVGYICFMYQDRGLMICEVQIKEEYKGKNTLRMLLDEMIKVSDNEKSKFIFGTINKQNEKSKAVFKHIGMNEISDELYMIEREELLNWISGSYGNNSKMIQ